ncbi:MAG TPA: FHA domain-containing protein [Anaerolineales bacterium]|nr:FHA domain-containing protein [Anaerolineales bacterium]
MDAIENICPVCKTRNEPEAIVCGKCGAALDDPSIDSRLKTKTTDMQALTPEMIQDWSLKEAVALEVPESGIAFYVEGRSNSAYIDSKGEFILGRKSETTSETLVDLAPFGGYSLGLSRRHVVVRWKGHGYEVMDLGSVNGTWLNEERLVPHQSYPLPSGSHLRLGRMRILVLYHPTADTN